MLTAVEGIFKDGKVELLEEPADIREARVIVTFLPAAPAVREPTSVDLRERRIGEADAAGLRARLRAFAEDWEREDMRAYDAL